MTDDNPSPLGACCESASVCVFARALRARAANCELAERRLLAEGDVIECPSPVARINCVTLAALMHERARFALRLPGPGQPLMHAQAMRLHCGGLLALQHALEAPRPDVHRLIGAAHERCGSLTELPWGAIVQGLVAWQPGRARRPSKP